MRYQNLVDQTCDHIRIAIETGRWTERLPGERRLSSELTVSRGTLKGALRRLHAEGLLGEGRAGSRVGRAIIKCPVSSQPGGLRVGILVCGEDDAIASRCLRYRNEVIHRLLLSGHSPCLVRHVVHGPEKIQKGRLAKRVEDSRSTTWILDNVPAGILRWFEEREMRVLADVGPSCGEARRAYAGSRIDTGLHACVEHLLELGHRRIVLIAPHLHRKPELPAIFRVFLNQVGAISKQSQSYHIPEWDGTSEGLQATLASLFRFTPPTAIIAWDTSLAMGVSGYLLRTGHSVPRDVSLAVITSSQALTWLIPGVDVARLEFDEELSIIRTIRWVEHVAAGHDTVGKDYRVSTSFRPGNTLAPPKS